MHSEMEEVEYEGGGDGPEDENLREDDTSANGHISSVNSQEEEPGQHPRTQTLQRNDDLRQDAEEEPSSKANDDDVPEDKSVRNNEIQDEKADSVNSDNEYQSLLEHRQANKYNANNDADDQARIQHLTNRDINNNMVPQNEDNQMKKIIESPSGSNEEGDFLFENTETNKEQTNKADVNSYNNGAADSSEQARYFKQYYNTMQVENRGAVDEKNYMNRDRRQTQDSFQKEGVNLLSTPSETEELENTVTEDEEAAIKRHVSKLTGDELQELLNSLSDDKRELLKKIMESDNENKENVNKREITKKAGAVEENNLEGGLADSSKLQLGSVDTNTGAPSTGSADPEKQPDPQPDLNDLSVVKSAETANGSANLESKAVLKSYDPIQYKSANSMTSCAPVSDSKNPTSLEASSQATKTENKREANSDDIANFDLSFDDSKVLESDFNMKDLQDSSSDQRYFCPQDDELSRLMNDESQLHNNNANLYKRETFIKKYSDLDDSIKSLEESFPNSNSYDDSDPYSGSDMAPLVRVKRKNDDLLVKKRAAGVLPEAKVAFVPYRAENDDEDNDEGSEFDDDGFYDRTSSLARNHVNDKPMEEDSVSRIGVSSRHSKVTHRNSQSDFINRSKLSQLNDNLESDTMSLGSDTDSVISGVEGVDDNLMYNSGSRNKRTLVDTTKIDQQDRDTNAKLKRPLRSTPLVDEGNTPSENYINAPNYQDSDAFGPLPRNYEGELSRYKRIRRVKQSPTTQEVAVHNV